MPAGWYCGIRGIWSLAVGAAGAWLVGSGTSLLGGFEESALGGEGGFRFEDLILQLAKSAASIRVELGGGPEDPDPCAGHFKVATVTSIPAQTAIRHIKFHEPPSMSGPQRGRLQFADPVSRSLKIGEFSQAGRINCSANLSPLPPLAPIFWLSGGGIWKSVVKLFASIRFDLLA